MLRNWWIYLIFVLWGIPVDGVFCQVRVEGASAVVACRYLNDEGGRDSVYVVNLPVEEMPEIVVEAVSGSGDIEIYEFDYGLKEFGRSAVLKVENQREGRMEIAKSGGYKIKIREEIEREVVIWVYLNAGFKLYLLKNDNGEVLYNYKQCGYTDFLLSESVEEKNFGYVNPLNGEEFSLENEISYFVDKGEDKEKVVMNTQGSQQYFRVYGPPMVDRVFSFEAVDDFNFRSEDKIYYKTILPEASFEIELPDVKPSSAPVEVIFSPKQSPNISEYTFRFGDGDSVVYDLEKTIENRISHTYFVPKEYVVTLAVRSLWGCEAEERKEINVEASSVDFPNVFSPNGDGINDYFLPENTSIRDFELKIYNSAGRLVYSYKGEDLRNWQGWNGNIKNTNSPAATGVYFYSIKAASWENPSIIYEKSGAVHLYR